MQQLDWEDEQQAIRSFISTRIHPHKTMNEWWESIGDGERKDWIDYYQEYQYGSRGENCGDDCFSTEVVRMLDNR